MTKRQSRMILVAILVSGVSLAGYFGLKAFNENLLYYFSPTDVVEGKAPQGKSFRLGGLVGMNSVKRDGIKVSFDVTDNANTFTIKYEGILPDLFREGQGIITTGSLVDGTFMATEVLAKHDENYMPPEVAESLKKSTSQVGTSQSAEQ
ncbi:Cytochrome c-type biogenesis protein CcmE, heme chaperone [uncultured Gammaproteobacteria bacterium]|uniref:cytochrome c maturation protein CcmE n=1 Tax=Bathymodiolus heckerae thiotrophic gill symbiont TaxID=1052212 RepID=UPI0010BBD27A|nr:cytochrome c maturation protein CcmE [Bathymodiolus heckerae thiotrophic gill symbiont]CAC9590267.1 Cytochrome c-type biogenesis protein CcmE, heme chaperone [uncultured Gammaproteobacteria bacterium]CAC9959604.1 Cytochrome c-type biogenesis protein CcmE, heme chaperone [uncultured Gammaproteobacteria bacterium]SHN92047.1 Cytochrome c-type biogenesis protein CcmE, heme chaperone [Bathymodiolus heckerae thiotrophic gill symbiont]